MYERAYDFLKENNSEGATAEQNREGLIQILGEDWIGFWAILDQIMFYEGMVDELSTLNATGSNSRSQDDVSFSSEGDVKNRKNLMGGQGKKVGVGALNEDSDLEIEAGEAFNFENDENQYSDSDKGEEIKW